MAVTMMKIAEIAGVSRGTVDRALNGRPGVKEDVAKRIIEIAETLGYKPNIVAKSLATRNRSGKIGVIINSEGNPFFDEVLRGIEYAIAQIADFGIKVIVKTAKGYDVQTQLKLIDEIVSENINALAITPINDRLISDRLKGLKESGIELVTFNTDIESVEKLAYVGCDYEQSGRTAAGMLGLITGGRAEVLIITGSKRMLGHNLRIQGFQNVIKEDFRDINIVDIVENNDNDEYSYYLVRQLLDKYPEINALYFTAAGTKGGIQAVCDMGLGSRIKIITFDLTPAVYTYLKAGTVSATICQQPFEQGYQAIQVLFDYLVTGAKPVSDMIYTQIDIKLKYNIV